MFEAEPTSELFQEFYYQNYLRDMPYDRSQPGWLALFGNIADAIVSGIQPQSVLDAGCALGFLVEALRDRGVEAYGVDISEYAIEHVREDIRPHCKVGSLTEPLPRKYDLIVCLEVVEHLTVDGAMKSIANLCRATNDVIFSSSPVNHEELTHFTTRATHYWADLFARHGFIHDLDDDLSFITPWAMRFRKRNEPLPRIIADYERRLWSLSEEAAGSRRAANEVNSRLAASTESLAARDKEIACCRAEIAERERACEEYRHTIATKDRTIATLHNQIAHVDRDRTAIVLRLNHTAANYEALQGARGVRLARSLGELSGRIRSTIRAIINRLGGSMRRTKHGHIIGALELPLSGTTVSAPVAIRGWALSRAAPIGLVEVFIGRQMIATLTYGQPRPDVLHAHPQFISDLCGFDGAISVPDTTGDEPTVLVVLITDQLGNQRSFERQVFIAGRQRATNGNRSPDR